MLITLRGVMKEGGLPDELMNEDESAEDFVGRGVDGAKYSKGSMKGII
jgi:hypothetical protein